MELPQDRATKPALVQPLELPQDQAMEQPESPPAACPRAVCSTPQDSVSEAEEKIQKLEESNAQLEDRVRELEGLICEVKTMEVQESVSQLDDEKSELMQKVNTLCGLVQEMGAKLCQTHRECEELKNECERKQEAHSILLVEYDEMKMVMTNKEELLKVSLADAEQKHQKALESIVQLEEEKSELMHEVNALHTALSVIRRVCDKLTKECEHLRHAHRNLLSERDNEEEKEEYEGEKEDEEEANASN